MAVCDRTSCPRFPLWRLLSPLAVAALLFGADARAETTVTDMAAVERALAGTGFGVDALLRRDAAAGEGGPFIPLPRGAPSSGGHWDRLNRALTVLPLAAPLQSYELTSGFGRRRDPINHRRAMHPGVDLRAPLRAPVSATAPGRVTYAGRRGGYGLMVEIDHGLGVRTRYAHLSAVAVRAGQMVTLGRRIGLVGSSGRSTGPHLHYEVLVDGRARNPQPFLKAGQRLGRDVRPVSDSALLSTDRPRRDSRASPNSRGCPCP